MELEPLIEWSSHLEKEGDQKAGSIVDCNQRDVLSDSHPPRRRMSKLGAALEAFIREHEYGGELDSSGEGQR